jgi:hypothetical protein
MFETVGAVHSIIRIDRTVLRNKIRVAVLNIKPFSSAANQIRPSANINNPAFQILIHKLRTTDFICFCGFVHRAWFYKCSWGDSYDERLPSWVSSPTFLPLETANRLVRRHWREYWIAVYVDHEITCFFAELSTMDRWPILRPLATRPPSRGRPNLAQDAGCDGPDRSRARRAHAAVGLISPPPTV